MNTDQARMGKFLAFSATVTGFSEFHLLGTGQSEAYLATVTDIVGEQAMRSLLSEYERISAIAGQDREAYDSLLRTEIFFHELLGPVVRNIIKLWYSGTWYQLPREWRAAFGAREGDRTFVVSPTAYTEGLLWRAIDANPSGAKGPGYGSWGGPPQISDHRV